MRLKELIILVRKMITQLYYQLSIPPKMLSKKLKDAAITACQNILSETSLSMTCLFWLWYTNHAPIRENTGPWIEFQKWTLVSWLQDTFFSVSNMLYWYNHSNTCLNKSKLIAQIWSDYPSGYDFPPERKVWYQRC